MNKCLYCGKPVKNKFCNTTCQNKVMNTLRKKKRVVIQCHCEMCGDIFDFEIIDGSGDIKRFCSRKCANTRSHTQETKDRIRQSLLESAHSKISYSKISYCEICGNVVKGGIRFCSISCRNKDPLLKQKYLDGARKGGRISAASQQKRSKNEIYFAELCSQYFSVKCNEPMFNGWDADVVIEDLRVAVLWNGPWHYNNMGFNNHSLAQVQNRDKIKLDEIVKMGYYPYIIRDVGKNKEDFVIHEFQKFKQQYKF